MKKEVLRKISGNILINSKIRKGTIEFGDGPAEFSEDLANTGPTGTLIPTMVNAHTHIGDFFIDSVPEGGIPEIVGPGGFKMNALRSASDETVITGMKSAQQIMYNTGTTAFIDFRESGRHGIDLLKASLIDGVKQIPLGRLGDELAGLQDIIDESYGLGYSSVSDVDIEEMKSAREICRTNRKIYAIHFSENKREGSEMLSSLKPDLLVHCLETEDSDLELIRKMDIPIVITPRSNVFYGKRPDYTRLLKAQIKVMLGTDNGMVVPPDMFQEMHFLYLYQRSLDYLDPETILTMTSETPRLFLHKFNVPVPESYIFFPNVRLTPFEIVTRSSYLEKRIVTSGDHLRSKRLS